MSRAPNIKMSMNLELARRMEENKDLSERRARILQEQRERLKEEARAQENYHMSVYQVSLRHRVESFSRRNRWILSTQVHQGYRVECSFLFDLLSVANSNLLLTAS